MEESYSERSSRKVGLGDALVAGFKSDIDYCQGMFVRSISVHK